MQANNPSLDQFSNHYSLIYCTSHCFENNFIGSFLLKESGGVGYIISHPSLSSDAYLVLVYRTLCLGLLYPLIPIHSVSLSSVGRQVFWGWIWYGFLLFEISASKRRQQESAGAVLCCAVRAIEE